MGSVDAIEQFKKRNEKNPVKTRTSVKNQAKFPDNN
jgi:hypothetical protein